MKHIVKRVPESTDCRKTCKSAYLRYCYEHECFEIVLPDQPDHEAIPPQAEALAAVYAKFAEADRDFISSLLDFIRTRVESENQKGLH